MKLSLIFLCWLCHIVVFVNGTSLDTSTDRELATREAKLLVGAYSTRTQIVLTTITSIVPSTCIFAAAANGVGVNGCKKRRRRSNIMVADNLRNDDQKTLIDSSLTKITEDETNREGRLKITFWSTITSSFTFVSTSINTASVFSVSYFCTIVGFSYPAVCG